MSMYSDADNEDAMKAISKLAKNSEDDLTLEEAIKRLKKIADIADGGELPLEEDEEEDVA